jgi:hypothetical protein
MLTNTIKAKIDLFNDGKCFTKGKYYQLLRPIGQRHELMNAMAINDLGQSHQIGLWYKHFTLVRPSREQQEYMDEQTTREAFQSLELYNGGYRIYNR